MAINPFRKGGNDTIPIEEGGTGATTAAGARTNLGISAGYVISLGATAASNDFFLVNGDANRAGTGSSDHATRAVTPIAATISAISFAANGNDTISLRRNGAFLEAFATSAGQGVFIPSPAVYAAGDYLELRSGGGVVAQFQCYFVPT